MIRRPPRSTQSRSSAASDVYKRQGQTACIETSRNVMWNVHEIRYGNRCCRTCYHDCHGYNRKLPSASPKGPEEHRPSLNADTVDKERQSQVHDFLWNLSPEVSAYKCHEEDTRRTERDATYRYSASEVAQHEDREQDEHALRPQTCHRFSPPCQPYHKHRAWTRCDSRLLTPCDARMARFRTIFTYRVSRS